MNPKLSPEQRDYHISICSELPTHMADSSKDLEPILYRDSRGRLVLEAQLWSHTAGQISEAIVAFVSPENSRPQLGLLRSKFVTLFQDTLLRHKNSGTPLRCSIWKFFNIFNSLFFGDILVHCKIKATKRNRDNEGIEGECVSHQDPTRLGVNQIVLIEIVQSSTKLSPSACLSHYLEVLIHEMLHASFALFSCHCNKNCTRLLSSSDGEGMTGHGIAWQNAAAAISSFIKRDSNLRSRINNIEQDLSLVLEIQTSGLFEDYRPYMKGWSLDPQEIQELVLSR